MYCLYLHPKSLQYYLLKLRKRASWADTDADIPKVTYEELDVMKMEMPPASRGYGVDNTVHHPDTAKREQEIKEIKKANPGADRFELQELLNPTPIPEKFKGKNERIGRGFK